ncbi:hypothetical protein DPEC_G00012990 [Dallia pectoralis]|uniref:Uncharacterized protein n=1 Tax=Dallia pectoralis TaxID=75939 RepID=A0ACC2HMJ8_DALPE|nr:hypothetical protein DPEC_G00012990 [Dallia pectoralis]
MINTEPDDQAGGNPGPWPRHDIICLGLELRPSVQKHMVMLGVVGSIVKDKHLLPDTYFSNSRNVLNTYFVKVSWGWTLTLLTPFIYLTSEKKWTNVLCRLSSLVVATAVWYTFTEAFFYIEDVTGTSCVIPKYEGKVQVPHDEIKTSLRCRRAGGQWDGFDISGHSFILSFCVLVIADEMAHTANIKLSYSNTVLDLVYVSLNVIVVIWVFMFCCTSVYFHEFSQKFLGTFFGILGWYITHRYKGKVTPLQQPPIRR